MADADRTYKVRIQLITEQQGADPAKALKDVGSEAEKARPFVDKIGVSHHELHHAIRLIERASPEAGAAMAAMALGPMGALMALSTILEIVKKHIENQKKAAEDATKAMIEGMDAATDSTRATGDAVADLEKRYDDWQTAMSSPESNPIGHQMDEAIEKIKAVEAELEKVAKDTGASPADIEHMKGKSADEQAAVIHSAHIDAVRDEIIAEQKRKGAQESAEAAATAAKDFKGRSEAPQHGDIAIAKAARLAAAGRMLEAQGDAAKLESQGTPVITGPGSQEAIRASESARHASIDEAHKREADAAAIVKVADDTLKGIGDRQKELDKAAAAAAENLSKLGAAALDAKKFAEEIGHRDTSAKIEQDARHERERFEANPFATAAGNVIRGEFGAAQKVLSGKGGSLSEREQTDLTDVGAAMSGHKVTLQQAAALVMAAARDLTEFTRDQMQVAQVMANMGEAVAQSHGAHNQAIGVMQGAIAKLQVDVAALQNSVRSVQGQP